MFGNEGPGQSKGAVEDGTRGQCRDDNDCTPWAPSCSPLGYCRGGPWGQDGSFGSPTNPKAGGEQSDWIKKNAKSGGGRNEEYYGKIEDDNRRAHVKFRNENPIFYEQIPVLKPRLEKIEKNVYEPCTYCKYNPEEDNGNSNSNSGKNGGSRKKNKPKGRKQVSGKLQSSGGRRNNNTSNRSKNNRKSNNKKNNNTNGRGGGNNGRKNSKSNPRSTKSNGDCGRDCIKGCPKNLKVYMACALVVVKDVIDDNICQQEK